MEAACGDHLHANLRGDRSPVLRRERIEGIQLIAAFAARLGGAARSARPRSRKHGPKSALIVSVRTIVAMRRRRPIRLRHFNTLHDEYKFDLLITTPLFLIRCKSFFDDQEIIINSPRFT